MRSRRLIALVLVCSLPLILPRGWCCIFSCFVKSALTKSAPLCPSCCSCASETSPDEPGEPEPPRPVKRCPCNGRDTTLPSGPERCDPDLAPPGPVIVLTLAGEAI